MLLRDRRPLLALIALFGTAQVAFFVAGVRTDTSSLGSNPMDSLWQLLDVSLLEHHLVQSIWYLHSQPPLFNLAIGLLVHLPPTWQVPLATALGVAGALTLTVLTYFLLTALGVSGWIAALLTTIFVVADPEYVLFQNWLGWSYFTALLSVTAVWCLLVFSRTRRGVAGAGFFSAAAALVLLDSTFQWEWLALAICAGAWLGRHHWKQLVSAAAVPLLLVAALYAKDAAVFGTTATSSWLGMNLAKMVFVTAPPALVHRQQEQGSIGPLAAINPFSEEIAYAPRYGTLPHTGIPALDETRKQNGALNFNNRIYLSVSEAYLHQDLAFIRAEPGRYLYDVSMAVQVWQTPGDQYFPPSRNRARLAAYSRLYDRFLLAQPLVDPATPVYPLVRHQPPPLARLSFGLMLVTFLALVGSPIVAWRWRRENPSRALCLAFIWATIAYSFVVTSLIEVGENERFRFELGTLPLVAMVLVVTEILRTARSHMNGSTG